MTPVGWVALLLTLAFVPATIAARKTPSRRAGTFATYYVFGALFWIVAVPAAIWAVKDERYRRCPHCAERVRCEAIVCPHCQRGLQLTGGQL